MAKIFKDGITQDSVTGQIYQVGRSADAIDPPTVEPSIIKDPYQDLQGGSDAITAQKDKLAADYKDVVSASTTTPVSGVTITPESTLADLQKMAQGISATDSAEEKRIKQAGIDAGAQYDPLIQKATREKGKGLGISEVSAGEAGGFMNTQFVGMAAEAGLNPEQARIMGRYGTGGELTRIKSEYDANISSLESQKQAAISQAENSMRQFIQTGKQSAFDNAYKMFEAAQKAADAKQQAANDMAKQVQDQMNYVLNVDKYNLEVQKYLSGEERADYKEYLEGKKLDVDIAALTGEWNGAKTVAEKKRLAEDAYRKLGYDLDVDKFNWQMSQDEFKNDLESKKLELETSKYEAERNGEDIAGTADMVMKGLVSYADAKGNLKYGKAALDKALAGYKQVYQDAYKETGNDYYKIKQAVGGKTPTATTVDLVGKMNMAGDSLTRLKEEWNNIDKNKLGVVMGQITKRNFTDADAVAIKAQLQALIPTIARGVFGEVGVLTDNDIKQYRGAVMNISDPIKAQQKIFDNLLDTIESKFASTLRSNADGGYNVSGYADNYKDFMNQINNARDVPKKTLYSTNPGAYNSLDEFASSIGAQKYFTWMTIARENMKTAGIEDPEDYFQELKNAAINKNLFQDVSFEESGGTIQPNFHKVGADTNKGVTTNTIGGLSEKYESGGNPGAIGYDNTGGYSYGTYQLAHQNAKKFVEQSPYAKEFQSLTFNSPEWQAKWKEIAKEDPEGFGQSQKSYISNTHYVPQLSKIVNSGIDINKFSPVLQDVIWSTAVQHGPNTDVIVKAYNDAKKILKRDPSDDELITQIYNERATRFPSSTPEIRASVQKRFAKERDQALKMLA